eukprot:TRINITY_DN1864_c0_g1_i1.p1 TRINITY_DN1864_c0_g1~~TRINITY_DN1864_c0_g1_i1.p1  ORF type:complete len:3169 (-),score=861.88 TRINITY_DN1864_c0_g1_i1:63-9569(-)
MNTLRVKETPKRNRSTSGTSLPLQGSLYTDTNIPEQGGTSLVTKARQLARQQAAQAEVLKIGQSLNAPTAGVTSPAGVPHRSGSTKGSQKQAQEPPQTNFLSSFLPQAAQSPDNCVSLLTRLVETQKLLEDADATLVKAAAAGKDVTPAGEWLLDNFYVIREHISDVRSSMPKDYYSQLPKLTSGSYAGYPRVYELALQVISSTEGVVTLEHVSLFIKEYQRTIQLKMGELWAFPIMLRLGLIGNIWRMTKHTLTRLESIEEADQWANILSQSDQAGTNALVLQFVTDPPPLTSAFVSRFVSKTRQNGTGASPLYWLEKFILERGVDAEESSRQEHIRLALTNVVMGNSITSLRNISRFDWLKFLETHSETDRILTTDPAGVYSLMSLRSRDNYRHSVENIGLKTGVAEDKIANAAINLSRKNIQHEKKGHVGYYLVDDGLLELETAIGYHPTLSQRINLFMKYRPFSIFFGSITTVSLILLFFIWRFLSPDFTDANWLVVLVYWGMVVCLASDLAVSLVHQAVVRILPPLLLPSLDFGSSKLPEQFRTVVVVPTLFPNIGAVKHTFEQLEVLYLANKEQNIYFAILSDYTDSKQKTQPNDEAILSEAETCIQELQTKHPKAHMYLFHRPRLFNEKQDGGTWMGWERKRGKLVQFNEFLIEDSEKTRSNFVRIYGKDQEALRGVKYVITLDADTVLPRESAKKLIGTIAHPLNRAEVDPTERRVVKGYGIIQPRVTTMLKAHCSQFAAVYSGRPGIDPYTTSVSDVYQDLFGEGSFTGKGIYDVRAFHETTEGRFEDNKILSHDLIEGSFARAGLCTEIEVFDDYPSNYIAYSKRKHRWMRGDWQLLRWGIGFMFASKEKRERLSISNISRWKIFDNMRRTIVEIVQFLFLLLIFLVLPSSYALLGTWLAVQFLIFPWELNLALSVAYVPLDGKTSLRAYFNEVLLDAYKGLTQIAVTLVFLPDQAVQTVDAIVRTMYRLLARANLLEWTTQSQVEALTKTSNASGTFMSMWQSVLVTSIILALAIGSADSVLHVIIWLPFVLGWIAAPYIAYSLSSSYLDPPRKSISRSEREVALRYALLHWRFFNRFATKETQWLAPDNFQEDPEPVVAMRTSPTNIALQLLSTHSAHDLGFITTSYLVDLLSDILGTVETMPRYKGHLYNWYGLKDQIRLLDPPYISTVDSGNFAAALIALKQSLLGLLDRPVDTVERRSIHAVIAALQIILVLLGAEVGDEGTVKYGNRNMVVSRKVQQVVSLLKTRVSDITPVEDGKGDKKNETLKENETLGSPEDIKVLREANGQLSIATKELKKSKDVFSHDKSSVTVVEEVEHWLEWSVSRIELMLNSAQMRESMFKAPGAPSGNTTPVLREQAKTSTKALKIMQKVQRMADLCQRLVDEMDFKFLFNSERKLFSIGLDTRTKKLDPSLYDLLASECRFASYVAIAKGDAPAEHWFRLGRSLVTNYFGLVSWSGTMFEYLMPLLLMECYPNTLLDRAHRVCVAQQIAYSQTVVHSWTTKLPWGVSESAYNFRDREQIYQYRAFGVPTLALKRGQEKDYVVSPYSSILALYVEPHLAMQNLSLLESIGALGPYGFNDAIDYTRPAPYGKLSIVRNYMAHHIGMGLVTLCNVLNDNIWQKRFHSDPLIASSELLLHERVPREVSLHIRPSEANLNESVKALTETEESPVVREFSTPHTAQPRVSMIGTLPYIVLVDNSGSGFSNWQDSIAVTRWRNDRTCDNYGTWIYVKDVVYEPTDLSSVAEGSSSALDVAASKDRKILTERVWSAGYQPTCSTPDYYRVVFAVDKISFTRKDGDIETLTEIAVNTNHSAELRVVTLRNFGTKTHEIQLTSYGEIVLQAAAADRPHPAFGNLFVETEWLPEQKALLARRRPRSVEAASYYLAHIVAISPNAQTVGDVEYESNRGNFIGRCRTIRDPQCLDTGVKLQNSSGSVLDPIFSIRTTVRLEPGDAVQVTFTTLVGNDRPTVVDRADIYSEVGAAQRTFDISGAQIKEELHDLSISSEEAMVYQMLVGHCLFTQPALACPEKEILLNNRGVEGLWAHGISGDWPILLALIEEESGIKTVREILRAHMYWRQKGITIDVVIVNTQPPTYLQDLQNDLGNLLQGYARYIDKPGGIFLRRKDMLPPENYRLLLATSRVHIHCTDRGLAVSQFDSDDDTYQLPKFQPLGLNGDTPSSPKSSLVSLNNSNPAGNASAVPFVKIDELTGRSTNTEGEASPTEEPATPMIEEPSTPATPSVTISPTTQRFRPKRARSKSSYHRQSEEDKKASKELDYWNGVGGFTNKGDYEIRLSGTKVTPAPWVNIVANEGGSGFCASENGGGFTWVCNSFFYRLTPWQNDPVVDPPGEVIYIRDDSTGEFWSATPSPIRHHENYTITHKPGSTTYRHAYRGISTSLTMTMSDDNACKIFILELTNLGVDASSGTNAGSLPGTPLSERNLTHSDMRNTSLDPNLISSGTKIITVTSYIEWVLGQLREHTQHQVITFLHGETRALCARNYFQTAFAKYTAFHWCSEEMNAFTCDRREFLGRNGSVMAPMGLQADTLIEALGASHDPCAVTSNRIQLAPGASKTIVFLLGATEDVNKLSSLIDLYKTPFLANKEHDRVVSNWDRRLNKIQVHTPSKSFDLILNKWLLYQALSCRLWGRSAVYQSGGAFGFRDQLQDVMSIVYCEPHLVREHIILSASRQFKEGDVQHWWHQHTGRGIRTKISDDLVWLPFVVEVYCRITGDNSILDEEVPYLDMRMMNEHEEDIYDLPQISSEKGTIYDHCLRALDRASTTGPHELPLIGTGDWNDGMNKVGHLGKGESVWLAWFIYVTNTKFSRICDMRNDTETSKKLKDKAQGYMNAAENSWDGNWYRRAYYDDGTPLGSHTTEECSIDSLAQSWAVISGASKDPSRIETAMNSVDKYLVDSEHLMIKLLHPPFNSTDKNPGYIKGYLPGVRENGAQYTHAALWVVLANAISGRGARAFELFQMINPISHTTEPDRLQVYRVEPYVCAADIYGTAQLSGRGGWTWYTGSASWMYRTGVEGILGLKKEGGWLSVDPCVDEKWKEWRIEYREGRRVWRIEVRNEEGVSRGVKKVEMGGKEVEGGRIWIGETEAEKKEEEERRKKVGLGDGKSLEERVEGEEEKQREETSEADEVIDVLVTMGKK